MQSRSGVIGATVLLVAGALSCKKQKTAEPARPDDAPVEIEDAGSEGQTGDVGPGPPPRVQFEECEIPKSGAIFDSDAARRRIRSRLPAIRRCYERQLLVEPALKGRVEARLFVADGTAERVLAKGMHREVAGCVGGALERLSFPADVVSGEVTFTYPFTFAPEGEGGEEAPLRWNEDVLLEALGADSSPARECLAEHARSGHVGLASLRVEIGEGGSLKPIDVGVRGPAGEAATRCLEAALGEVRVPADADDARRFICVAYFGSVETGEDTPAVEVGRDFVKLDGVRFAGGSRFRELRAAMTSLAVERRLVDESAPGRPLDDADPADRVLLLRPHQDVPVRDLASFMRGPASYPPAWKFALERRGDEGWERFFTPTVPFPVGRWVSLLVEEDEVTLLLDSITAGEAGEPKAVPRDQLADALEKETGGATLPVKVAARGSYRDLQDVLEIVSPRAASIAFEEFVLMEMNQRAR